VCTCKYTLGGCSEGEERRGEKRRGVEWRGEERRKEERRGEERRKEERRSILVYLHVHVHSPLLSYSHDMRGS
jgi:hypothetical protein